MLGILDHPDPATPNAPCHNNWGAVRMVGHPSPYVRNLISQAVSALALLRQLRPTCHLAHTTSAQICTGHGPSTLHLRADAYSASAVLAHGSWQPQLKPNLAAECEGAMLCIVSVPAPSSHGRMSFYSRAPCGTPTRCSRPQGPAGQQAALRPDSPQMQATHDHSCRAPTGGSGSHLSSLPPEVFVKTRGSGAGDPDLLGADGHQPCQMSLRTDGVGTEI